MSDGEWTTPGIGAAQPSVPDPSTAHLGPAAGRAVGVAERPPRPLPMRPQSVIEILDGGFAIVRARPGLLLGISALFIVPFSVLSAFLRRGETGASVSDVLDDPSLFNSTAPGDGAIAFVIGVLGRSLVQTIVAFAVGRLVAAWYSDREADLTEVLRWIFRRIHVIVAAWVLVHVLEAIGLLGVGVGALIVATFTIVVAPALAIERLGPIAAIRRSFALVRGRFAPALGFFLLSGLLAETLGIVLGLLPTLLGYMLSLGAVGSAAWVLVAIGSVIAGVVSTTFLAAATVALYLDIRVRREGIDLQLLIPDLFEPA